MTSATHYTTPSTTERRARQTTGDAIELTVFIITLVVGTAFILWNGRALTPDFVDRANAEGSSEMLDIGSIAAMLGFTLICAVTLVKKMIRTSSFFMVAAWFTMVWTMASLARPDYDGRFNPYVRRMDPLPWQYEDLTAAKALPAVAAQIRAAAKDGRIDRGEAHDILDSRTYSDARAVEFRRRQAVMRREILKP
jgi:hypothetical protein